MRSYECRENIKSSYRTYFGQEVGRDRGPREERLTESMCDYTFVRFRSTRWGHGNMHADGSSKDERDTEETNTHDVLYPRISVKKKKSGKFKGSNDIETKAF